MEYYTELNNIIIRKVIYLTNEKIILNNEDKAIKIS